MKPRMIITTGGTGGHIIPALSLAEEIGASSIPVDLLFVGGKLAANDHFPKDRYPYQTVSCSTISLSKPWKLPYAGWNISKGVVESMRHLRSYDPDLIVGFGSYYSFPTLVAARLLGVPYILHESNRIAGRVNRLMSPKALTTALQFPDVPLSGHSQQVAMPQRGRCRKDAVNREEAAAYFGLDPQVETLLIVGGSQGASALNRLAQTATFPFKQVIHLTGSPAQSARSGWVVKSFEPEMHHAWTLADAALCRAGAATIAELTEFEVPAVLIPYPYATDGHQEANARFFAEEVGGGICITEDKASPERVAEALGGLSAMQRTRIHHYKETHPLIPFHQLVLETIERLHNE